MNKTALAFALCVSAFAPAAQAQDMPVEADLLFWCGSAFAMMAAVAETPEETETALAASAMLSERGAMYMFEAGIDAEDGAALLERYDAQVVNEFETGQFSYEASMCADLITPPEQ
ncbi:hypothetical protein [Pelagibacterium luteolum]|uniref:HdeA/HdeB family protein n=1 Tax=Pelagibacterium luteolum TaxID=440168 RepID=A0A1G7SJD0_9HYPH|nr:hypothetical protein [Pelagibacterium luteolum]SDG23196.1 hypothetical protein SAMN04487974_101551 [Pelagibacterium luteolum]